MGHHVANEEEQLLGVVVTVIVDCMKRVENDDSELTLWKRKWR